MVRACLCHTTHTQCYRQRKSHMTLTSSPFIHRLPHLVLPPLRTQCTHLPAASCAFGHRLFLTSYMISSKFICDDAYSNKVSVSYKQSRSQQLIICQF